MTKDALKKGKAVSSDFFYVKFIPTGDVPTRFSVVAGLKVSKKAVIRNKIKRRVREIARTNIFGAERGYFIAIIVKPSAVSKDFLFLKKDLAEILRKIK